MRVDVESLCTELSYIAFCNFSETLITRMVLRSFHVSQTVKAINEVNVVRKHCINPFCLEPHLSPSVALCGWPWRKYPQLMMAIPSGYFEISDYNNAERTLFLQWKSLPQHFSAVHHGPSYVTWWSGGQGSAGSSYMYSRYLPG